MSRDLGARLSRIRSTKKKDARPAADVSRHAVSPGDGWERTGSYTFVRKLKVPNPVEALGYERPLEKNLLFGRNNPPPDAGDLLFFDLETTGLSAGPGTAIFLAGFGSLNGADLEITQFFLADYPGEREFLEQIRGFIPDSPYWISYNGKSFDAPMMITKGILHGIRFSFPRHGDLLHLSRRLWKPVLPGCSLSQIEQYILHTERPLDIPGALAPQMYFDYLKTGDVSGIQKVAAHHYEDIQSLARLLARVCMISRDPLNARPADSFGLGFLLRNEPAGLEILNRGFENGEERCGVFLAAEYKRCGNYEAAVGIWKSLFDRFTNVEAAVEIAKFHEHRTKDFDAAESWTVRAADTLSGDAQKKRDILHRLERIRLKREKLRGL